MELSPEALDALITGHMRFLSNSGYLYEKAHTKNNELLGSYLECSYCNTKLGITLEMNLFLANNPGTRDVLVFHLSRGNKTFSLTEYLKYTGASEAQIEEIGLYAQKGSLDQRVEKVLSSAAIHLQGELLGVVNGKEWVDVPIDWGDYK